MRILRVTVALGLTAACGSDPSSPAGSNTAAATGSGPRTGSEAVVPAFCGGYPAAAGAGQWQSSRVYYASGRLTYATDSEQNRIPDYSYAGYRYGEAPIPVVPGVARLAPAAGDNTARIQQALDQVAARAPDVNGIRGALVLEPGAYEIRGTVRVNASGVVLRGSGDGGDPGRDTILQATGDIPHQRSVVVLGSGDSNWTEVAPRSDVATAFVPAGSLSLNVESASGFAVGDSVVIRHPSTQSWLDAIGGGGAVEDRWQPGQVDIFYYRRLVTVAGNTLGLDAPIYNHLDRRLSPSYVTKVATNVVTRGGVESVRIDIQTAGPEDENHAWNGVAVFGAHDSWVRGVTALHFGYGGVRLENAVRVTVENCQALDPVAIRTGGRMYNFASDRRVQLALFSRCHASYGRHGYIANGTASDSGIVYHRCRGTSAGGSEGGHRQWVTGVLYDNLREQNQGQVLLINRGDSGTGHGWGAAHSTIWKYNSELVVQKPPTAQNYGITDQGHFRPTFYNPGPAGHLELTSGELVPASLYEAQFCERLRR